MKGVATVAVISILMVSLIAGCGGVCGGVEVYTDSEQVINTTVNQEFIIALDSNPTTGYGWEASYDENMLSLEKEEYSPNIVQTKRNRGWLVPVGLSITISRR
ncbi:MAG: hypothetical protein AUK39_02300 [Dehalococcoidia bacterium CG2_30_46_19]|nr:MAG: hypothetical protein AUK39_02300 [Dehalococcoidia bacterium CG2_30_46_19]